MKIAMIVSVLLAVVTSVWTWMPRQAVNSGPQEKIAERLTTDGAEIAPERVAYLNVASPESDGSVKVFEVKKEGSAWVIPSQYNYPADGGTRVGALHFRRRFERPPGREDHGRHEEIRRTGRAGSARRGIR